MTDRNSHSIVLAADYRVSDVDHMLSLIGEHLPHLMSIGAHHVVVYRSIWEPGRILVTIGIRYRESVEQILASAAVFELFDDAGVTDIPVTPPAHRVFVSALAPAPGDTGLDALPVIFRWFLRLRLRRPIAAHRAVHLIPKWLAMQIWCRGLEPADRRLILSRLCAESPQIPVEPTPRNFGGAQRSNYIVLEQGKAISPRLQLAMAAGLGIADVRRIDAGHEAMFGHPADLAAQLNALAFNVFDQEGCP
jgi:hypothetical protein